MRQVVIENPVINSPFSEPVRHFKFDEEGITDEIVEGRRESGYFIPVPAPKGKRKGQVDMLAESWIAPRFQPSQLINKIRPRLSVWRSGGYHGVTRTTARLLEHWNNPDRERKLFFCQIEALETAIYLAEVAKNTGDAWIDNELREASVNYNPLLHRVAFKMATGSGKTVVMAMLIAWQALNKRANPQDARFSDAFLIVTPGITIKDRLRVLLPNDPDNYYKLRDIVPPTLLGDLENAKILITNFHAFLRRDTVSAGKLTKEILQQQREKDPDLFKETPAQMVRRVCRDLGTKQNIVIINDEAHHCYRRKPDAPEEKIKGEEGAEAKKRNEEARIWISGLEAVKAKIGARVVYDLSATPFFLRGSGEREGLLFPWVVSDFSLIDAIESGIAKVPRVPVADDADPGGMPTYRDLWHRLKDAGLPKKSRKTEKAVGPENLPKELQGAIHSLYTHYEKEYRKWEQEAAKEGNATTPPVFIVVCQTTNISNLIYQYIAGWEKQVGDETVVVPGELPLFRNDDGHRGWLPRPNTILIDSAQLESGEVMSAEFKKIAALEIEEFKHDLRVRFPGRDTDDISDEALLREVMNTVGKPGKLGEGIRCVVSVSMLTEGWDANTVTHILGVRAFGTQLLCEQVVGRGLRRMSYEPEMRTVESNGARAEFLGFAPEYAEVYGVPFAFIPCSGGNDPKPRPTMTRVYAVPEREAACEITFPRVVGYRWDFAGERLHAQFTESSRFTLDTKLVPSWTDVQGVVGEQERHRPEDLMGKREQEIAFRLAKLVLEKYFRLDGSQRRDREHSELKDGDVKAWLFPDALAIAQRWVAEWVTLKDNAFKGMLLLVELAHDAADKIYHAIAKAIAGGGEKRLVPILQPYDTVGSTKYVDFDTSRPLYRTREDKCHVSHVVCDTDQWEQKVAQALEEMPQVRCYVKNQNLGFEIPYTLGGQEHRYIPDFLVKWDDGQSDPLNLILECSGEKRRDKEAKVATALNQWVPAVNNHGGFERWGFVEVGDPWELQASLQTLTTDRPSGTVR